MWQFETPVATGNFPRANIRLDHGNKELFFFYFIVVACYENRSHKNNHVEGAWLQDEMCVDKPNKQNQQK